MSLLLLAIFSIILRSNACILCTLPRLKLQGLSLRPVGYDNDLFAGHIKDFFVKEEMTTRPLHQLNAQTASTRKVQALLRLAVENDKKSADSEEKIEIKEILISWIRWYRNTLSPIMPPNCRFLPSCSNYAMQAIAEHGSYKGLVLTTWRILRCNPFGGSGYDPPIWPPPGFFAGSTSRRMK